MSTEASSGPIPTSTNPPETSNDVNGTTENEEDKWRLAKVVCDYDATNMEEMCLMMDEVCTLITFLVIFVKFIQIN